MALLPFTDDVSVHTKLGDNPGADNGLTSQALKEEWDKPANIIKNWINNCLIPIFNSTLSSGPIFTVNGVQADENGNAELSPKDLGAASLSDLRRSSTVNVLDNSDFTHFIAQAGLGGKHGNSVYAGDRWVMTDGSINGNTSPDGFGFTDISISANKGSYCNLYQKLGNFSAIQGAPYTVALYDGSGIYVGNFKMGQQTGPIMLGVINFFSTSGTNVLLRIPQGQTASIKWVMVIPGTYTADTLPNYPSKGYAAELAQCQMYYKEISLRGVTGFVDNVTTNATFKISESEMRINPTAKILETGNAILQTDALGSVVLPITSVVSVSDNGTVVTIAFTQQSYAIGAYSAISVYSGSVALSADL